MGEISIGTELPLSKPKNGLQKKVDVSWVSGEVMGGSFYKRKVESGEMKMVVKRVFLSSRDVFPEEADLRNDAERYVKKWQILRDADVPTASSMRVVDENTIAMGDMTRDGSKFFGKELWVKIMDGVDEKMRELTPMEKIFLGIDSLKIKEEMGRVLKLAWDKGIRLPYDDPYDILVHPDGSFEVLVLDLSGLRPRKEENEAILESELTSMKKDVDKMKKHLIKISTNL